MGWAEAREKAGRRHEDADVGGAGWKPGVLVGGMCAQCVLAGSGTGVQGKQEQGGEGLSFIPLHGAGMHAEIGCAYHMPSHTANRACCTFEDVHNPGRPRTCGGF